MNRTVFAGVLAAAACQALAACGPSAACTDDACYYAPSDGGALRRIRVVALVGPRQAGKTTLARMIVGEQKLGEFPRFLQPHTAVGEVAPGPVEEVLLGRVVQEDGVGVGEFELHLAQGIVGSWKLEQAPKNNPYPLSQ